MAREKDPNRELAFKLWRENQEITNREIAKTLEVDEKKIATWKSRDKWKERVSSPEKEATTIKKNKCSTTKQETVVQQKNVVQQIEEESEKYEEKSIKQKIADTMLKEELDDKQRVFCIYYIKSFNATQSAIKAGYSKSYALVDVYRLLENPSIKNYLNKLKKLYAQGDYLDTQRLLERHKQIAFADVKDFTEFKVEKTFVDYDEETGNPIFEKSFQFRIKDDVEVDGTLIKKIGMGKFGPVIELEDRAKSLDFLNKFYGIDPAFKMQIEKLEIERNKVKSMDERNRILENANKPPSSRVEDMTEHELDNYLKKYGGA
ncbi:MAG: terminase small subunit [Paraclostridium sp.]